MTKGVLVGHAITGGIAGLPLYEHTYVTSNKGHVWPCRGRKTGGMEICRGSGNTKQAQCLSKPNSFAGIIYGQSGVCHQMANRILYPSGKIVYKARLFWLSLARYGLYGKDLKTGKHYCPDQEPWKQLAHCRTIHREHIDGEES